MALGDLYEATAGNSSDIYYVDTEMYDTAEYGAIYIIDAERPALVDTGIGKHYEAILDALGEVGIAPEELAAIIPTHVHLDHAGGTGYLAEACPNADVYCYEAGVGHLVSPTVSGKGRKPPSKTRSNTTPSRSRCPNSASRNSKMATPSTWVTTRSMSTTPPDTPLTRRCSTTRLQTACSRPTPPAF